MAEPILKMTRGVPKTDREWMHFFRFITKFFRVSGNELQIGGDIALPPESVGTTELEPDSVTNDKLRDSSGLSVIGRALSSGGSPADIVATVSDTFMVRRGGALTWDVLEDGDIPADIARDVDVSDAIAAHVAETDPHPQYLTQSEGDSRYRVESDPVPYADVSDTPSAFALLLSGAGSPEGAVAAPIGAIFLRTDGGVSTTLYVKESGSGNTGWQAK